MEGTAKPQMNAEEMLAELKRALESSTRAPDASPPSASTAAKASPSGREPRRTHWGIDPPVKVSADDAIGQPTGLQKPTKPSPRRRKLTAGGLAVGGAAVFFAGAALMSQVLDRSMHEFSVAGTGGLAGQQNKGSLKPSSDSRSLMKDSELTAPLQTGALEAPPDASAAPATAGSLPGRGKTEVNAPHHTSSDAEWAMPAFMTTPPNLGAVPVASEVIRPDGTPIATSPSTPASTDSAHPAETPKPAATPTALQKIGPDAAPIAAAPRAPAATASAHPAEAPKLTAPPAVPQMIKPEGARIAATPSAPASTGAAAPAETPKPNPTPTAQMSNESTQPSTPKTDSKKKALEKASLQKPVRSPARPVKPIAEAQRQSTEPARPKEAEKSPAPMQGAVTPAQAAPTPSPSVPQRVADGVTHAFGYLVHLPGALVPHLGGSNPDAH
jgi:hypothetical protein